MSNHKIIGDVVIPIDPAAPEAPAPKALVLPPESHTEVELGDGATLSAPSSDGAPFVVHLRPDRLDDERPTPDA